MSVFTTFINSIFSPSSCKFCKKYSNTYICEDCKESIAFVYEPFCVCCQKISLEGYTHKHCYTRYKPDQLITLYYYSGVVRNAIHKSKYSKKEFALIYELINYALEFKEQFNLHILNNSVLTYIPSDIERYKKRGFNLSQIISSYLATKLNSRCVSTLKKVKSSDPLFKLTKQERSNAVKDSFEVLTKKLPENIILVDDITTTGSTFLEASKVLKRNGVKNVICLALCYQSKYKVAM